jgi:hypothetical protein
MTNRLSSLNKDFVFNLKSLKLCIAFALLSIKQAFYLVIFGNCLCWTLKLINKSMFVLSQKSLVYSVYQYFNDIVAISLIGGENRINPPTCRKSLTNFIT